MKTVVATKEIESRFSCRIYRCAKASENKLEAACILTVPIGNLSCCSFSIRHACVMAARGLQSLGKAVVRTLLGKPATHQSIADACLTSSPYHPLPRKGSADLYRGDVSFV